eukprot:5511394-Alexandrium_andersonii.AAC.1
MLPTNERTQEGQGALPRSAFRGPRVDCPAEDTTRASLIFWGSCSSRNTASKYSACECVTVKNLPCTTKG